MNMVGEHRASIRRLAQILGVHENDIKEDLRELRVQRSVHTVIWTAGMIGWWIWFLFLGERFCDYLSASGVEDWFSQNAPITFGIIQLFAGGVGFLVAWAVYGMWIFGTRSHRELLIRYRQPACLKCKHDLQGLDTGGAARGRITCPECGFDSPFVMAQPESIPASS